MKLQFSLFIFPFFVFLDIIQSSFYSSQYWIRYTIPDIRSELLYSKFPELKNPYFYMLWFNQCFWNFLMNIIPLCILYILSVRTDKDEISEQKREYELDLVFNS